MGYIIMIVNIIGHSISTPARKAAKKWAEAEKIMFEKIIREIVIKKSKVPKKLLLPSNQHLRSVS